MPETPSHLPPSSNKLMESIEASPHAEILRDESHLRSIIIDAMKQSTDEMTREIALGLVSGTMTWSTIATTSAYSDFLEQGLTALQQFDFTALNEHLELPTGPTPTAPLPDDDDEEDLWQGLYRPRT